MMSAPQDTDQNRRRLRSGPVIAVLAVMVVVLLCVVGLLAARAFFPGGDEPAEGEATTSSAPPTAPSKPLVREDLKVTVGEGGTGTSQYDPSVPIGYEPTCKGAVEAATNYLIGLDQLRPSGGALSQEDYLALLQDRTTGDYQAEVLSSTKAFYERVGDVKGPTPVTHPDWGGFTLIECTEGKSATVNIVSASDYTGTGEFYYTATSTELTWADGDWKVSGAGEADSPTPLPEDPVTEPDDEVSTLVGTHTQWENYEDAQ